PLKARVRARHQFADESRGCQERFAAEPSGVSQACDKRKPLEHFLKQPSQMDCGSSTQVA
ncbi:hypothetical protein SCB29_36850, partial [Paraburkholderia sp. SIMBA_055]